MGNSSATQHSKWRIVTPENSLLDLHEGHSSRSSDVPNALVCWENNTRRSTDGVWSQKPFHYTIPNTRKEAGELDYMDKNKRVGFLGDVTVTDEDRKGAKRSDRKKKKNTEVTRRSLHVSDDIISQPMVNTNITIVYNEDILQCPKHCSLAAVISADIENQLENDVISRFQKKFGRYDELTRQGLRSGGLGILSDGGRFIYYLVIKRKYWDRPSEADFEKSVIKMALHCDDKQVRYLVMNRVAALNWNKVLQIVSNVFMGINIKFYMYK